MNRTKVKFSLWGAVVAAVLSLGVAGAAFAAPANEPTVKYAVTGAALSGLQVGETADGIVVTFSIDGLNATAGDDLTRYDAAVLSSPADFGAALGLTGATIVGTPAVEDNVVTLSLRPTSTSVKVGIRSSGVTLLGTYSYPTGGAEIELESGEDCVIDKGGALGPDGQCYESVEAVIADDEEDCANNTEGEWIADGCYEVGDEIALIPAETCESQGGMLVGDKCYDPLDLPSTAHDGTQSITLAAADIEALSGTITFSATAADVVVAELPDGVGPEAFKVTGFVDTTVTYRTNVAVKKVTMNGTAYGTLDSISLRVIDKDGQFVADTTPHSNGNSWLTSTVSIGTGSTGPLPVKGSPYKVYAIARVKKTTGTGATAVIAYDSGAVHVATIRVNKKALDSTMINITGKYLYTGAPQEVIYTVKDGTAATSPIIPVDEYVDATDPSKITQAGTTAIVLSALEVDGGNYTGKTSRSFTIDKAPLTVDAWSSTVNKRFYDGTSNAADTLFNLVFDGLAGEDKATGLAKWADYTITNGRFLLGGAASSAVGEDKTVTGTVALTGTGTSKNYTLTGGTFSLSMAGEIEAVAADSTFFVYTEPDSIWYNGRQRPIGAVSYKAGVNNGAGASPQFRVLYGYTSENRLMLSYKGADTLWCETDTTIAPTKAGTYPIHVRFTPQGTNFTNTDADLVHLFDYVINPPAKPEYKEGADELADTSTRQGVPITLAVDLVSPNKGALIYRWYRYEGPDVTGPKTTIAGVSGASYRFPASTMGEFYIGVTAVNRNASVQMDDSLVLGPITVTVKDPPIAMIKPWIVLNEDLVFTYNGTAWEPGGDDVSVFVRSSAASDADTVMLDGSQYSLTYVNNVNAGNATIRATGRDEYSGTVTATFAIAKKEIDQFDLMPKNPMTRQYAPSGAGAGVVLDPNKTSVGSVITEFYDNGISGKTEKVPVNVGTYVVTVNVTAGSNLTAGSDIFIGVFTITPREIDTLDLEYNKALLKEISSAAANWAPRGIGEVKVKESVGTGYGALTVLYGGLELSELPAIYPASYNVTLVVEKGEGEGSDNFAAVVVDLGTYEILDSATVSVAEAARELPQTAVDTEAGVKPIAGVSADFTVGPSPVRAGESVKFFWSGKPVTGGTIFVYDVSGKLATKVAVKASSAGVIGSWKASVAEGTYLAKGVLKGKDGKREKVSFLFVVTR